MYDDNTPYLFTTEIRNAYVREEFCDIQSFFSRGRAFFNVHKLKFFMQRKV